MTPRHALQAAAKQFGFDGTDRSLTELAEAYRAYQEIPPDPCMHLCTSMWTDGKATCFECGAELRQPSFLETLRAYTANEEPRPTPDYSQSQHVKYPIPVESCTDAIPATLTESHSE